MSENWKLHDLVVVRQQPKMQPFVQIEGLIAVIIEIDGDYATIAELQLTGHIEGVSGVVELACLDRPTNISGPIRAAYAVYKQSVLQQDDEPEPVDTKRLRRALRLVAEKYELESKVVHRMLKDLDAAGVVEYYGK